ncbi:MAG: MoxR family ATPase [Treponemataceae bacterium]|nr:MoxR family ATPase [Treponemataceae bacterium]
MSVSIQSWTKELIAAVEEVFYGKQRVIKKILCALLSRGHVLLEDVPGTGKTIVARAVAAVLELDFKRIQCTPDLLPADVLGVSIWSAEKQRFLFKQGPIVSNIVLVDEINRATPRTQSALLEAMAERQISVEGKKVPLPEPFFIMATENPVEFEGTFPLPEAQKDRFLLSLSIGYPDRAAEALILESQRQLYNPVEKLSPRFHKEDLLKFQEEVTHIHVDPALRDYILALVQASREHPSVRLGVSPRGSLALYRASQAWAAMEGRRYVIPEDIRGLVADVFRKRIILKSEALIKNIQVDRVVESILESVPVPVFKEGV